MLRAARRWRAPPARRPVPRRTKFAGAPGWYTLHVEYFDQSNGVAHYRVSVGSQPIDEWAADLHLCPPPGSTPRPPRAATIPGIALRPGDEIRIEGVPDGGELRRARLSGGGPGKKVAARG
jgi:hypothetical protein